MRFDHNDWKEQVLWNAMDEAYHQELAQQWLTMCSKTLGLQEDAQVLAVKDRDRFILSYEQDPTKPDFAKNMIKLETLMRQTMSITVDLRLEPKEDKNKRAARNGRKTNGEKL